MNTAQKILKNTLSLLMSGVLSQILGFVVIVYLARVLAPEDFGKVSFAVAVVAYFTLMVNMGLPLLGTRETARDLGKVKIYVGNILTIRLTLAAISFGLLLMMAFFLGKSYDKRYLIILYGLGLLPSALLLDWAFQGIEKMEYIGLGRILSRAVYLGLVIWFVKSPKQLLFVPCFQITGNFLGAMILLVIFIRSFSLPRLSFDISIWKSLLLQALPLGFSIIMIQVIYNIDTVMLGFMRSDAEIGYYNAAYRIIFPLTVISAVYFDAIFPVLSKYYKSSLSSFIKLQKYTAKLMVMVALPLSVGGTVLARSIMNLVYGSEYDAGILPFQILIWVTALIYINSIYARGLWACDKQNEFMKIVTVQATANIGLNLVLIPYMGIGGAAVSTVAAELIGLFLYHQEFNKVVCVPVYNKILKPLFASVLMGFSLYWGLKETHFNIFLMIAGGAFIYGLLLYLMREITKEDLRLVCGLVLTNRNTKSRESFVR
jgi:O-antigen/teichoic acid export membrane protein